MMKSRYQLEFLGIGKVVKERDLENRLVERLQQFLLELGYGFCFVGRQSRLTLGRKDYFVDLLFYHRFLKALVAFDLKIGAFEPWPRRPARTRAQRPGHDRAQRCEADRPHAALAEGAARLGDA